MVRTLAILTITFTGITSMYAGSLGINPGDYLNPDGSVSIGLLPTVDGITTTAFSTGKLENQTMILNGGITALPQTSTSCASNCQGGSTLTTPAAGTATIFKPASAPEFSLLGDGVDTNSVQDWVSTSSGTGTGASTITIPVGIFGVADVSTMLNTISGLTTGGTVCTTGNGLNAGTNCTNTASYAYITLNFSTSATGSTLQTETFALINGLTQANILDGATAGTSASASNYTVNYLGQNYTVDAGLVWGPNTITGGNNGSFILDAQEFPVFEQFQSLYLTSVSITDTGTAGTGTNNHEVLSAVSITPTPEPSTILLLGAGLCAIGVGRFRRSAVKA